MFGVHGVRENLSSEVGVGTTKFTVEGKNHTTAQCYHSALQLFSLLNTCPSQVQNLRKAHAEKA